VEAVAALPVEVEALTAEVVLPVEVALQPRLARAEEEPAPLAEVAHNPPEPLVAARAAAWPPPQLPLPQRCDDRGPLSPGRRERVPGSQAGH
jgi:hypothetical protein